MDRRVDYAPLVNHQQIYEGLVKKAYRGHGVKWLSRHEKVSCAAQGHLTFTYTKKGKIKTLDLNGKNKWTLRSSWHKLHLKCSPSYKKKFERQMDALALRLIPPAPPPKPEKIMDASDLFKLAKEHYAAKNVEKGSDYLVRAAFQGHPEALYQLGRFVEVGSPPFKKDPKHAAENYAKAADKGHRKALCALGMLYFEGNGFAKDYDKAFDCFEKNALLGCVESTYMLAFLYITPEFRFYSPEKAVAYFLKAANNGYAPAQFECGQIFEKGKWHAVKSEALARNYYQMGANQGSNVCQTALDMLDIVIEHP